MNCDQNENRLDPLGIEGDRLKMGYRFKSNWKVVASLLASLGVISLLIVKFAPLYKKLLFLTLYSIPSNSFIPGIPHEPAVILAGKSYRPIIVALFASLGTCIAAIIDYHVLTPILTHEKAEALKKQTIYKISFRYFGKAPFISLVIAAFSPVPFFPFRVLSIASSYPFKKYLLSIFLGRTPRYYLLSLLAYTFPFPTWIIAALFLVLIAYNLIEKYYKKWAYKKRGSKMLQAP